MILSKTSEQIKADSEIWIFQISCYLELIHKLEINIKNFKKTNNDYGVMTSKGKIKEYKKKIKESQKKLELVLTNIIIENYEE